MTGQYRLRQNDFRNRLDVQQISGGKIRFQLVALWVSFNNPEIIHNGELQGEVALEKGSANFNSGTCRITMKFGSNKVVITESDVDVIAGLAPTSPPQVLTEKSITESLNSISKVPNLHPARFSTANLF